MYAKTGLSFIAAAGVAVGVVGMTMGGASGSTASCVPTNGSRSSSSDVRANDARRSASDNNSSNASGANGAGSTDPNGTGVPTSPAGTDDNTNGNGTNPGTTIVAGGTVPDGSDPSTPSTGSGSSSWDRPLLHVTEHTNQQGIAGATAPASGTSVIGRSSNISGLHIFAHANQGR
jgi:hypothetical protein